MFSGLLIFIEQQRDPPALEVVDRQTDVRIPGQYIPDRSGWIEGIGIILAQLEIEGMDSGFTTALVQSLSNAPRSGPFPLNGNPRSSPASTRSLPGAGCMKSMSGRLPSALRGAEAPEGSTLRKSSAVTCESRHPAVPFLDRETAQFHRASERHAIFDFHGPARCRRSLNPDVRRQVAVCRAVQQGHGARIVVLVESLSLVPEGQAIS